MYDDFILIHTFLYENIAVKYFFKKSYGGGNAPIPTGPAHRVNGTEWIDGELDDELTRSSRTLCESTIKNGLLYKKYMFSERACCAHYDEKWTGACMCAINNAIHNKKVSSHPVASACVRVYMHILMATEVLTFVILTDVSPT